MIFVIVVIILSIMLVLTNQNQTKAQDVPDYEVVSCKAMTPEEAMTRFPDTTVSDWTQIDYKSIMYYSLDEKFLEVKIGQYEYVKSFGDDALASFYDSQNMYVSATKLEIVCLDIYPDLPVVDYAPMVCPADLVEGVIYFGGNPEGWNQTMEQSYPLMLLSYVAAEHADLLTIIVPKNVLAITPGGRFGPGSVIPDVTNVTLRMYCSLDLTVHS